MTEFGQVLVTDRLAYDFFALAVREKLLYVREPNDSVPKVKSSRNWQQLLSLIVLFDKVTIHNLSPEQLRLPDLEKDGIIEIIHAPEPEKPAEPLNTKWKRGPLHMRKRPPKSLLRSLTLIKEERPLIIERLLTVKTDFDMAMSEALGITRRQYLNTFLDYAIACVEGDADAIKSSVFQRLLDDLLQELTSELFDFQRHGDQLSPTNATLVFAIIFADELRIIKELSQRLQIGVATKHYRSRFIGTPLCGASQLPALDAATHFLTLRAVVAEEKGVLPKIEGISHALALRRDANLKSLRAQLKYFHTALQNGEAGDVALARKEISAARKALQKKHSWQFGLDWLTYLSVPIGVAEALAGLPPVAGMGISVFGAAGAFRTRKAENRHQWVLFGL